MADTIPDISHRDQLSVCIWYVNNSKEVSKRLLEIVEVLDKTRLGIEKLIESVIINNGLFSQNVVFQSYDFASQNVGQNKWNTKKLSELFGHKISFISCQAHRKSTFPAHCCDASIVIGDLFSVLEYLFVFILPIQKGFIHVQKSLSMIENSLQLRNLSKTRWTAYVKSLKSVWVSLKIVIKTLKEISTDKILDKNTWTQALEITKKIFTFDFIVSLYFIKNIMYKIKILIENFKSKNLIIIDVLMSLNSFIDTFNYINYGQMVMDNLKESTIKYALKLGIDPESDFNRIYRKRLLPKKLVSNLNFQTNFDLSIFYWSELCLVSFKVLDILVSLSSDHKKTLSKINYWTII